jgi:hypothetical protein
VLLSAASCRTGARLPAFDLTDRGDVASVHIHAFTAGNVTAAAAEQMRDAAESALRVSISETARLLPLLARADATHTGQRRRSQIFPQTSRVTNNTVELL